MTDSVKVVNEDYVRRIHSKSTSGKLHKGHSITAATASIPSKYQTIVIDNAEKKGFNSRSKRFQYDSNVDVNPGPGCYVSHGIPEKQSTSFSKKGTGGFASKDRRLQKYSVTCSPGPGAYGLPGLLVTKRDYNKALCTSVFHQPIAQPRDLTGVPAPNEYDVLGAQRTQGKGNNVTADAAFKSRSKRSAFVITDASSKPAPWQYHISERLVKDSVRVPVSSFKSKTRRQMQPDPVDVPGPGTYHPHEAAEPVDKTLFPRKHYLCISAPAMPLPPTPAQPGPGNYELVDYEGPQKHFMSGSAFVSNTSRWTGDMSGNADQPGPAHYRPVELGKQSFIYNNAGRWI